MSKRNISIRILDVIGMLILGLLLYNLYQLKENPDTIKVEVQNTVSMPMEFKHEYVKSKGQEIPAQTFNVTAYTLREEDCGKAENHPEYGITASMAKAKEWYTIAGPKSLPFGTVVYIPYFKESPNKGIFVVEDRGGLITEGHLDIYMKSKSQADKFGRRNLKCFILYSPSDK